MKIIGWIFIICGISVLASYFHSQKISELVLSIILLLWGVLSILYKKYQMKDDIYIGTRYLDGQFLAWGMYIFGMGIFSLSLTFEQRLTNTSGGVITSTFLIFVGCILIIKGFKKYQISKKIDSENPSDRYIKDRYE